MPPLAPAPVPQHPVAVVLRSSTWGVEAHGRTIVARPPDGLRVVEIPDPASSVTTFAVGSAAATIEDAREVHPGLAALRVADRCRAILCADGRRRNNKRVNRAIRAVTSVKWGAKAKEIAASLKAQHAAGRDGDDSPAEPVWPTPKEQLDALKKLFRTSPKSATADADATVDEPNHNEESLDRDAEEVAQALRGVDWAQVGQQRPNARQRSPAPCALSPTTSNGRRCSRSPRRCRAP